MRPQVVAHRGSSAAVAEHTRGAYELALEEGSDALECDVRVTRDRVLVCVHDRKVNRVSTGRGVVSTMHYDELAGLDFTSWRADQRDPELREAWEEAELDPERRSVLTFERLLELALPRTAPSGRPVQLHVETKHPVRYRGRAERVLVDVLERYGLARPRSPEDSRITVMSYASSALRRIHQLAPTLPTVLLMERVPVLLRDGSLPPRVSAAGPSLEVLKAHPRYVERLHARGHRVHCYTADSESDIGYLLELGVDAIITNHPARARRLVDARG